MVHMLLISIFGLDDCPTTAMCCKRPSVANRHKTFMHGHDQACPLKKIQAFDLFCKQVGKSGIGMPFY